MKVTARAVRSGGWWAVDVPEVEGAFTQARRLDQVAAMAADAVATLTGVAADEVAVEVVPVLDAAARERAARVRELQRRSVDAQAEAAAASRQLVAELRASGLTVRDVAAVVGISPQRVSQLAR